MNDSSASSATYASRFVQRTRPIRGLDDFGTRWYLGYALRLDISVLCFKVEGEEAIWTVGIIGKGKGNVDLDSA